MVVGGESGQQPPPKPRREAFIVLVVALAIELVILSFVTGKFDRIFVEMELRELPLPTEAFLALSRVLRKPVGLAALVSSVVVMGILAHRGNLDGALKKLIWSALFLLAGMIPFCVLSVFLPIIRIQQLLAK